MIKIYVWPDGTWCHAEDIGEYDWMSDDYAIHNVPEEFSDNEIDLYISIGGYLVF